MIEPREPTDPIVFVGGHPEPNQPPFLRSVVAVLAGGLVLLVLLAGTGLWLLNATRTVTFRAAAGNTAEPATTRAFVAALHRADPVGMRAQVTTTCLADQNSGLCFGPEADARFRQSMAHRAVELTFLRRFDGNLGTIVLYDLFVRDITTGERVELILTLRLASDGRIDRAVTS